MEVDGGPDTGASSVDAAFDAAFDGSFDAAGDADGAPTDAAPSDAGPTPPERPTPEDIGVVAGIDLPPGDAIVFTNWSSPNQIRAIDLEGTDLGIVLTASRVWSIGASRGGDRIAFASAPRTHNDAWGLPAVGDAIQYTWIYDLSSRATSLLTFGNLNEDCLVWGPDDTTLYSCRRSDLVRDERGLSSSGYFVAAIDPDSGESERITPEGVQALVPAPGNGVLFYSVAVPPSGRRDIWRRVDGEEAESFRERADQPRVSDDGSQLVFSSAEGLRVVGVDGEGERVVGPPGISAAWSPDGTQIVYLRRGARCNHIELVSADGSDSEEPRRLRDCDTSGEIVTRVSWIRVPERSE